MTTIRSIVLAGGKGTRMKSDLPKVLHPILGQPMVRYAVDVATRVTESRPTLIVGYHADDVKQAIGKDADYALQAEQLGTGHAVMQAEPMLRGACDLVLVTSGDMPLFSEATLRNLVQTQLGNDGPMTLLTVINENPRGFGRIVRDEQGHVKAIVEEAMASPEILQIKELNVGAYCIRADWMWQALKEIPLSPKGEYYLTELVGIAVAQGLAVKPIVVANASETIGINTQEHLREAEAIMQARLAGSEK